MSGRILSDHQFAQHTNTFQYGYAGGTRNVHTGQEHPIGSPGFVTAIPGPHELTKAGPAHTADVRAHRQRMLADPAVQNDPRATQGSWHLKPGSGGDAAPDGETVTYDRGAMLGYDESAKTGKTSRKAARGRAISLGRQGAQRSIFDLKNGADIKLPGGIMHDALKTDLEAARSRAGRGKLGIV